VSKFTTFSGNSDQLIMDEVTLIQSMGRKPLMLLKTCDNEVASIRTQLGQIHRRLSLAPLWSAPHFKSVLPQIRGGFLDYVFRPIELPFFPGFAQMTQNSSFLACFIAENPEPFAHAVLSCVKSSSFQYLVNCAIPAVFGHFVSSEHFSIAIHFYSYIIKNATARFAIPILQPLLWSAATFRFLESSFWITLRSLIIHVNCTPSDDQEGFIPVYSAFLVQSIVASAPLLPQGILDLFQLTRRSKWSQSKIESLLFDNFLWPSAVQYIRYFSNGVHINLLQRIINAIIRDRSQTDNIFESLTTSRSQIELPQLYACFGLGFLEVCLSVHDVHVLAKTINSAKIMPATVTPSELDRPPFELEFSTFSCHIYPHGLVHPEPVFHPSLFTSRSREIELMEDLLLHTEYKHDLLKWLDILQSQENIVLAPIIASVTAEPSDATFLQRFSHLRSQFNVLRLSRRIYLGLLDARIDSLIEKGLVTVLTVLDDEFRWKLRNFPEQEGTIKFSELTCLLRPSLRPVLVDAVRRLSCIDTAIFHERLRILLQTMQLLFAIQRIENSTEMVCPIVFQQNKGRRLLSTFLILDTFAMKDTFFNELCTDAERRIWVQLESSILAVLTSDSDFLNGYITVQSQLGEIAAMQLECG
jgi:hypothetical protein